jgi:hypothetical protein
VNFSDRFHRLPRLSFGVDLTPAPPRLPPHFQLLIDMPQTRELPGVLRPWTGTRLATGTEVLTPEKIAACDYRDAHRTVFISTLRPRRIAV